ncbi:MAG: endonuclease NucS domain-containing protein [Promethearchaeota archaeon]
MNRNSKEASFEDVLEIHPYLIDKTLLGGRLERQYPITLPDGRFNYIDLIYFKENEIVVVELKRERIVKKDISQLTGYIRYIRDKFPEMEVRGILVGQGINEEDLHALEMREFTYKELFKDIPVRIKICSNCRKAVDERKSNCNWCGDKEFF